MNPYILLAQTQTYYGSDNQATQAAASSSSSSDLLSTLSIPIIIGIIIVLIFFIIGVVFIFRWWFVQSSIFEMEKDLDAIKHKLTDSAADDAQESKN